VNYGTLPRGGGSASNKGIVSQVSNVVFCLHESSGGFVTSALSPYTVESQFPQLSGTGPELTGRKSKLNVAIRQ
jgi:hypothetical protein